MGMGRLANQRAPSSRELPDAARFCPEVGLQRRSASVRPAPVTWRFVYVGT
jgi:hypothetical protein